MCGYFLDYIFFSRVFSRSLQLTFNVIPCSVQMWRIATDIGHEGDWEGTVKRVQ